MTTPVQLMEAIVALMQQDDICVVDNALDMSATDAAKILTEICPVEDLVFRPTKTDEDILAYRKHIESQPDYVDAIKSLCGDKYVG